MPSPSLNGIQQGSDASAVLHARAQAASDAVRAALISEDLAAAARGAALAGLGQDEGDQLVGLAPVNPRAQERLAAVKRTMAGDGHDSAASTTLERLLLLRVVSRTMSRVAMLPASAAVKALLYEEFMLYARPDARRAPLLALGEPTFRAACEVATLTRFPAGQLHWNLSGLSRRMLLQVSLRQLPRTLHFIARRMHGVAPTYFSHVNGMRRNRFIWLEEESNRSYHRMATSMRLQPQVLGLVTRSWFHDPDVAATSAHLAWTNGVILENGGLVVSAGEAGVEDGFLSNSGARRAAYEAGTYRPRLGLVLWPRTAMLAWSERNPQFADPLDRGRPVV